MQLNDLLNQATIKLKQDGIETARLDSEVLLSSVLNTDRSYFYTHPEYELDKEQIEAFDHFIKRRAEHEPVAYILGEKEFMALAFKVKEGVLIPRADTENLVEKALEILKGKEEHPKVLDLCCGSGAIGLSIKNYDPEIELTLSDISDTAIEVTTENRDRLGLEADILQGDLFEKVTEKYDLIISNPPYIESETIKELDPDIKNWEPLLALDGGDSGYDFYVRIIAECASYLSPGGCLLLEIGESQATEVERLMRDSGFKKIQILQDLAGLDRGIIGFWI